MKKLWVIAVVACAAFMVSCGSVESKAEKYAKETIEVLKSNDLEKMEKLEDEITKYSNGLSAEDKAKFENIIQEKVGAAMVAEIANQLK